MTDNKIIYSFPPMLLFDIKDQPFIKCSFVDYFDSMANCLYFNNENDKILWLLKWSNQIDEYIKLQSKRQMFTRWTTQLYSIHKTNFYTTGV